VPVDGKSEAIRVPHAAGSVAAPLTIAILTGQHLCHNPRVIKEAVALGEAGYRVTVVSAWMDAGLKQRDKELAKSSGINFVAVRDLTHAGLTSRAQRFLHRLRHRLGHMLFRSLGLESTWQLGYFAPELQRFVLDHPSDLVILHSEMALAAAPALLGAQRRIGVDMEDWFSEDLLPEARRGRPLRMLRNLEGLVLRNAVHSTCPSAAMSLALAAEFSCPSPRVVYNAFPWGDRKGLDGIGRDREDVTLPSLHWYSQSLGPGRGLEDLIAALPQVRHPLQIHLRGQHAAGFRAWLEQRIPAGWADRIHVHDLVSNDELLSRIAEHDIGFAGEMKYCRSRDLTVTNKILHYLLGGLAVVASDTAGQLEIAAQAGVAVRTYPSGDSGALAMQLNLLLESAETLREARIAALKAAQQALSWEHQAPVLLESIRTGWSQKTTR
jgi:glycosyltransferase involved in cell wall biosynthesis